LLLPLLVLPPPLAQQLQQILVLVMQPLQCCLHVLQLRCWHTYAAAISWRLLLLLLLGGISAAMWLLPWLQQQLLLLLLIL
jgi:hypothetical protein